MDGWMKLTVQIEKMMYLWQFSGHYMKIQEAQQFISDFSTFGFRHSCVICIFCCLLAVKFLGGWHGLIVQALFLITLYNGDIVCMHAASSAPLIPFRTDVKQFWIVHFWHIRWFTENVDNITQNCFCNFINVNKQHQLTDIRCWMMLWLKYIA